MYSLRRLLGLMLFLPEVRLCGSGLLILYCYAPSDDTDDEPEDQELEAHYMYMAQIQEVTPDAADNSGPIFDAEPLQKVQNNDDNYNVFAIENEHPKQPKSVNDIYLEEQGDTNITIDSLDVTFPYFQLAAPPVMLVPADVGFFVFNQLAAPVEVIGKAAVELKLKKSAAKLIFGTLLHVPGKTKDGLNARLDLAELGVKPELFAMQDEDKTTLPPAGHMQNRNKPEGCIAEETIAEETIEFFSEYHRSMETIGIPPDKHETYENEEGKPLSAKKISEVSAELFQKAHLRHKQVLKTENPGKRIAFLENEHSKSFAKWLREEVERELARFDKVTPTCTTTCSICDRPVIKKLSIVFKTPPKNYKDTYNEVDEEFSTVIHHRNDNVLPLVDRRDYVTWLMNHEMTTIERTVEDIRIENIVVNLDSSSDNNNSDSYSTSQISTSEEIDYDSPKPPKSLLKWYHYLSDEYKDNGKFWGLKSGSQASDASSKAKVEARGSKAKLSWNYFPVEEYLSLTHLLRLNTDNESTDMETIDKRNTYKVCIVDSNSTMSK
ncbi:hypothetical protein Tco_0614026, partial [Tanacetum coccineum]